MPEDETLEVKPLDRAVAMDLLRKIFAAADSGAEKVRGKRNRAYDPNEDEERRELLRRQAAELRREEEAK